MSMLVPITTKKICSITGIPEKSGCYVGTENAQHAHAHRLRRVSMTSDTAVY
jgi:hypothetical protein